LNSSSSIVCMGSTGVRDTVKNMIHWTCWSIKFLKRTHLDSQDLPNLPHMTSVMIRLRGKILTLFQRTWVHGDALRFAIHSHEWC
jgi:hypothetical protein